MSETTVGSADGERTPEVADLPLNLFDLDPAAVAARFDQARRRGTPLWLWPEVTVEGWREALGTIETATHDVLTGAALPPDLAGDPETLGIAAFTSGMGPLLGYWIEHGSITAAAPVAALFRLHLRHNRLRTDRLQREAAALATRMREADVEPTLLKGMHTAFAYFPEPGTRPMSDIDLLVPAERVAEAERVLRAAGYARALSQGRLSRSTWEPAGGKSLPRSLSLTHADDPWSLDLHTSLDRDFYGVGAARLDRVAVRAFDHPLSTIPARTLGQPLLALLLTSHTSEALRGLSLVRLVELVLVIRRDVAAGLLDWDELMTAATAAGALRFLYPALDLTERLAPGTVPEPALERLRAAATPSMRRVVAQLTPGRAQRLEGMSLEERFMWVGTARELVSSVGYSLWPPSAGSSPKQVLLIYRQRVWRLIRGALGR
jgi:hypothetical protein